MEPLASMAHHALSGLTTHLLSVAPVTEQRIFSVFLSSDSQEKTFD